MAKYLRYWGEFTSREGTFWRVEIHQEWTEEGNIPANTAAQEVFFPADSPLVIEWQSTEKYEPVQASSATLKLISDTDRQFTSLYTVTPASVRLDVFRKELQGNTMNWVLYWSGTLDTELYEEPYSYKSGYDVSLAFSDFGILSRLDFNLSGLKTVEQVLEASLIATGMNYRNILTHISTKFSDSTAVTLASISVDCANFYDEEGLPMTWREVMEGVLQPFAMRIIQNQGLLHIYDLAWIYRQPALKIVWTRTDAMLSRDRVYNNVSVNYSPYGGSEVLSGEVEVKEELNWAQDDNILVRTNYEDQGNNTVNGFRIYYGNDLQGSGLEIAAPAQFFKIVPEFSGEECTGVLWAVRCGDIGMADNGAEDTIRLIGGDIGCPVYAQPGFTWPPAGTFPTGSQTVFKCPKRRLAPTGIRLRVTLDLLYDVRYNPFEDAAYGNESGNWEKMKNWCNFGYVPVIINFVEEDGTVIGHYENSKMLQSDGYGKRESLCKWVQGAGSLGDAWLAYYNNDDRKSNTGFGGWQTNRQIIGCFQGELPDIYSKMEQGEYITNPAYHFGRSGYIELTVLSGILQFDYNREIKNIYPSVRWVAYKNPAIILVDVNGKELEEKDYEERAYLNKDAREDLSIDVVLGTQGLATSKGLVYRGNDNYQGTFKRDNCQDTLHRLLLGTVYSQYAEGRTILSGTARLMGSFGPFSDANTAGKFIMKSDTQNIREGEGSIEIVELSDENYIGIEYA